MAETATLERLQASGIDDEVDHRYCCDENVALCGLDLTGMQECPEECEHPECPLCRLVLDADLPCPVEGCKGGAT